VIALKVVPLCNSSGEFRSEVSHPGVCELRMRDPISATSAAKSSSRAVGALALHTRPRGS
jgi:hypothetical protein